jgi:hypothetical protein
VAALVGHRPDYRDLVGTATLPTGDETGRPTTDRRHRRREESVGSVAGTAAFPTYLGVSVGALSRIKTRGNLAVAVNADGRVGFRAEYLRRLGAQPVHDHAAEVGGFLLLKILNTPHRAAPTSRPSL